MPSNQRLIVSVDFSDAGRCAVTVNETGEEQLIVDGLKVRLPGLEFMFMNRYAPTRIAASAIPPMAAILGVTLTLPIVTRGLAGADGAAGTGAPGVPGGVGFG